MTTRQERALRQGKITPEIPTKKPEQICLEEIQKVLNKYDCIMVPEVLLSGMTMQSRVMIKKKPSEIIQPGSKNIQPNTGKPII